jgi:ribonuclease HII
MLAQSSLLIGSAAIPREIYCHAQEAISAADGKVAIPANASLIVKFARPLDAQIQDYQN